MLTENTSGPTRVDTPPNHDLSAALAETRQQIVEASIAAESAGLDKDSFMAMYVYGLQAGVTAEKMSAALKTYRAIGGPTGLALHAFGLSGLSGQPMLDALASLNRAFTDLGDTPPKGVEIPQFFLKIGTQMMFQNVLMYGNTASEALMVLNATLHIPAKEPDAP